MSEGLHMKRVARYARGSVVYDRRRKTWSLYFYVNGQRRSRLIGTKQQYSTKSAARLAADAMQQEQPPPAKPHQGPLVSTVIEGYRKRKMPKRWSTSRAYESRIKNHILPMWGQRSIDEAQACPVEEWIKGLALAPRSKGSIRSTMHALWKYALWAQLVPAQPNPIELVTIEGSSVRQKKFQSLTIEEGRAFLDHLTREPFRTIALVCVLLGLRISECLALRWNDVDWIGKKLRIDEGIVRGHLDDPKTRNSRKPMPIDDGLLAVLQAWRGLSEFKAEPDWIFASPAQLGRMPWGDDQVRRVFRKAAEDAEINLDPTMIFGTHSMRNSFRSWLDAAGASLAVQQKLMRHADIRTTMNVYGDVITDEMTQAQSKITGFALNSTQTARSDA